MIATSSPTVPWGNSWDPYGPTTVASYAPNRTYVITYSASYREPEPEELPWVESPGERRMRLSREGIVRRTKEALSFVCRVRSIWQRVLYVARTASQSERWRVLV